MPMYTLVSKMSIPDMDGKRNIGNTNMLLRTCWMRGQMAPHLQSSLLY